MRTPDAGATAPASTGRLVLAIAIVAMAALAYLAALERPGARSLDLSPEQEVALGPQSTPAGADELGGLDADLRSAP